jgi:hypothetical protein
MWVCACSGLTCACVHTRDQVRFNASRTKTRFAWSFASVTHVPHSAPKLRLSLAVLGAVTLFVSSCGDEGIFPRTVERGSDFVQEEVVFDDQFFYCRVEPVLFQQGCGSGVSGTDPANGCHFSVTGFRLTDYTPRVADTGCNGDALVAGAIVPVAAKQNYTMSQARMKRDPSLAALLQRPTGNAQHPREIFELDSPEADVIRAWATQFLNQ